MTAVTFDTHAYVKELKAAGFTEEQAEVQAKTLSSIFKANLDELATRRDLKDLEMATKRDIRDVKAELEAKIAEAKAETIKWMFGVAAGQAVFIISILKLFPSQ
ncbi:coiled-coil domain-containing protein [Candidatus Magnetaquicoccus inordinatus]|uniref:coiled-coil domain-containing protein n=1 Tax=Candidatus Magnetaquicoccus inordinatus TaxID=2496818 RepID=UPI00102BB925|nr:coiled-coil domain-containing protein [Candidatus Magnetaquicoccus inordinatus]